jgi:toxin FitB
VIIVDTNVLSALMRNVPDPQVASWMDQQPAGSLWTTSVSVLEIRVGIEIMPEGRKKAFLSERFERLLDHIAHRVAVFGEESARLSARLTGTRQKQGRAMEIRDTMIAGIVLAHHARLATRNVGHFDDIAAKIVNPWTV